MLGLLGAGIYGYRNLPAIMAQQARVSLGEYGVQDIRFEQFRVSTHRLGTDQLWLRGERDGLAFEATLSTLELEYNWRMLLNGQLQSASLAGLDLVVERIAPAAGPAVTSVSIQDLLPQGLMAQLPLRSLDIRQWQVEYRAAGAVPISAVGKLSLAADQLSLQLATTRRGSPITADISTAGPGLDAQLVLGDAQNPLAELQAQLARPSPGRWQWSVQGKLDHEPVLAWLDMPALAGLALLGESRFSGQIRHPDSLAIAEVAAQPMLEQFSADISLASTVVQLDYPAVVEGVSGQLDLALELDAGQLQLVLAPTALTGRLRPGQLSLPPDTQQWLLWQEMVPIRWQNLEPLRIATVPGGGWSLQLRNGKGSLGERGSELRWEALNLDAEVNPGGEPVLNTRLDATIRSRLRQHQLPQMKLALQQQGSLRESEFSLSLDDTAESMSLGLKGAANLATGRGTYSLSARSLDLPYAASTVLPLLRKFGLLEQDMEIAGGSITLGSELQSDSFDIATLRQQSSLLVRNLSGSVGEYRFEGLGLDAAWSGIEQWKTQKSVEFSLAKLDVGFDLVDIQALLALPEATPIAQPRVNVEQFTAGMFGGRVYLPGSRQWDFGAATNSLTLRAEQWQLADMVALQKGQDIEALGVLEGELPVTVAAGRIIIEKGYLRAIPPGGIIRYVPGSDSKALAASSKELGMAMDLLSDFQYEVLSSAVELDKEGNLLLGLSLAGSNPKQYEGRRINFNINLEQNLDPLLQSLRLSDKLVEKLESRMK